MPSEEPYSENTFHALEAVDGYHRPFPFSVLRGSVVVVVNVASLCGYTPQYVDLEALYRKYRSRGLVILGFPCNQFANQEPEDEENIVLFCRRNYGVTFPIMKKVLVNGPGTDPVYLFLKSQKKGPLGFQGIRWNFEKFVIDRNGQVVKRYTSNYEPLAMEPFLIELLGEKRPEIEKVH